MQCDGGDVCMRFCSNIYAVLDCLWVRMRVRLLREMDAGVDVCIPVSVCLISMDLSVFESK